MNPPAIHVKLWQRPCCDLSLQMRLQGLPESSDTVTSIVWKETEYKHAYKTIKHNNMLECCAISYQLKCIGSMVTVSIHDIQKFYRLPNVGM